MKPGNLRLQGAKSGGGNREMRERCMLTRPRRARFLLCIVIHSRLIGHLAITINLCSLLLGIINLRLRKSTIAIRIDKVLLALCRSGHNKSCKQ